MTSLSYIFQIDSLNIFIYLALSTAWLSVFQFHLYKRFLIFENWKVIRVKDYFYRLLETR